MRRSARAISLCAAAAWLHWRPVGVAELGARVLPWKTHKASKLHYAPLAGHIDSWPSACHRARTLVRLLLLYATRLSFRHQSCSELEARAKSIAHTPLSFSAQQHGPMELFCVIPSTSCAPYKASCTLYTFVSIFEPNLPQAIVSSLFWPPNEAIKNSEPISKLGLGPGLLSVGHAAAHSTGFTAGPLVEPLLHQMSTLERFQLAGHCTKSSSQRAQRSDSAPSTCSTTLSSQFSGFIYKHDFRFASALEEPSIGG